ncbi:hypothetical protein [Solimonas terrae]|uniref:hypothetical protein n=1 Tax=Solimonas terrae TaxID=1396819 RepID=UPI0019D53443|nr:hypothetical protein [Solimonas terrae]
MFKYRFALLFVAASCAPAAFAQEAAATPAAEPAHTDAAATGDAQAQTPPPGGKSSADGTNFGALGFAAGIGVTFLKHANVNDATLENGVVRVTDETKNQRALWLETHYQIYQWSHQTYGFGPFLAVQLDGQNGGLFDSVAGGFMIAMNRSGKTGPFTNLGFNVGYGWVSTSVKRLGDGLEEGQPLPSGVEVPYYRKHDEIGHVLMFSFTFSSGSSPNTGGTTPPHDQAGG